MKKQVKASIRLEQSDCIVAMQSLPNASIDCVLTDPPYLYLDHKLDRDFDESEFFAQVKRVLKPNGFIVVFGRGTSFYRWNTLLANLGFTFKEEVVWDKSRCSSPLMALSRVHETVAIQTKGKGVVKRVKVPYIEMKGHDVEGVIKDIKSLKTLFNNTKKFDEVLAYLESGITVYSGERTKAGITIGTALRGKDRTVNLVGAMADGMKEKTIIKLTAERKEVIHPTQKPVRLLERLLALVTNEGDTVLDPFAGSGSTAIACLNAGRNFVGYEIDKEYFDAATARIELAQDLQSLL